MYNVIQNPEKNYVYIYEHIFNISVYNICQ